MEILNGGEIQCAGYIFSVSAWWSAGGGIGLALVTAGYIAQAAGC